MRFVLQISLSPLVASSVAMQELFQQPARLATEVYVVNGVGSQEILDLGLRLLALLGVNPGIPVLEGVPGADDKETAGIIQSLQGLARDVAFGAKESGAVSHQKFIEQRLVSGNGLASYENSNGHLALSDE